MTMKVVAAVLAVGTLGAAGPAHAAAPCRPDGSATLDQDRAGGTLYVIGAAPSRTLIACRTRRSRPVTVFEEVRGKRLLRAGADHDDGVLVVQTASRQRVIGFSVTTGKRRFAAQAATIADEQVGGGRTVWLEGRRGGSTLKLFQRDGSAVALDTGRDLRAVALLSDAVRWRNGKGSFYRFTNGLCRQTPRGPATTTFPDSPGAELWACHHRTGRAMRLFVSDYEGLGGEEVSADEVAGNNVLFSYGGSDQYRAWATVAIAYADRGEIEYLFTDSNCCSASYDWDINAHGDYARIESGATSDLFVRDGQGGRTLDSGGPLTDLALTDTMVTWTNAGVARSATLRR